jgi:hypothetical protein
MKKVVLSLIIAAAGAFTLKAQNGIEIYYNGSGADISGGTHEAYLFASSSDVVPTDANTVVYEPKFTVTNNTGENQQWRITRKQIYMPSTWGEDQLCWPPLCYNTSGTVYMTPHTVNNPAPIVVDGTDQTQNSELAELKPRIFIDINTASYAHFRYYITKAGDNIYMDSVDITVNFSLGLNSIKSTPEMSISPNPATDYAMINVTGIDGATMKIVDVLGNVIAKEAISGTKKLDLNNFRNGVYFVMIEAPGIKTMNRKLIVKH